MYSMGNTRAIGNATIARERSIIPERGTVTYGERALKREEYVRWVYRGMAQTGQKGYFGYSMRLRPRKPKAEGTAPLFLSRPLLLSNLRLIRCFN